MKTNHPNRLLFPFLNLSLLRRRRELKGAQTDRTIGIAKRGWALLARCVSLGLALFAPYLPAVPLGTAFTYQGSLENGGNSANGSYDFTFTLYDAASGGSVVSGPLTQTAIGVTNGLFTATLDFGSGIFAGSAQWLEIGVRTNGVGSYTTLAPRQQLTPAPNAIYSSNSGIATTANGVAANAVNNAGLQNNSITANKLASGQVVKSLDGLTDSVSLQAGANVTLATNGNTLTISSSSGGNLFWALGGNAGTIAGPNFVGTTDNQPLEMRVDNGRVARFEFDPIILQSPNVILGHEMNMVTGGVIGGTIGGGGGPAVNTVFGNFGTIAGGQGNQAGHSTPNPNDSAFAAVGGGYLNNASGAYSTVGGGQANVASDYATTVAGGHANQATVSGAFVGGGADNLAKGSYSVIGGGAQNLASQAAGTVGGGQGNVADGNNSTVAGGSGNSATNDYSTVSGGNNNTVNGQAATICGGYANQALGDFAGIATGLSNAVSGIGAFLGGGNYNLVQGDAATVGGGQGNIAGNTGTTVAGGNLDWAKGTADTVGGGFGNVANSFTDPPTSGGATVCGGVGNQATNVSATVSGGSGNISGAFFASISGGHDNQAMGDAATVLGGAFNSAGGFYSAAGGHYANAAHDRSFVWSARANPAPSFVTDRFHVHAANGFSVDFGGQRIDGGGVKWFVIYDDPNLLIATSSGASLTTGGVWANASDRSRKTDFHDVDPVEILNKLSGLAVLSWHYTNEPPTIRHIGPVAQDFHAAFEVGTDDKTIGTVDEGGVALAAIQGLNQKVEVQQLKLRAQQSEIDELKRRLVQLEQR